MESTHDTVSRYDRQLMLPEVGAEGQRRLGAASVLVVGVGGLGSPASLYLAGAGVGRIGVVDDDTVSRSNLHRQVLYGESVVGHLKAEEAARRLTDLNPDITAEPHALRLTKDNAAALVARYDMVVDGCDNFATRYLLDDTCAAQGKPYLYGAVLGFEGQAAVFGCGENPRRYRDLYPDERATLALPHPGKAVAGMAPAVVGSVLAAQAMLLICGHASPLAGRLWTIDLRTMQSFTLDL